MQKPQTTSIVISCLIFKSPTIGNLTFCRLILDNGCVIHKLIMPFAISVAHQENTKIDKSRLLAFVMLMIIATIKVLTGCDTVAV